MERKHQVFVSSTYNDLVEERKQVIHALLELDCIPAGMELFPATDEDAWSLIKEVIDGCDYYLLIIAGKYGSQNSEGVSYTEMEYNYAVSSNKPIITFLHEDIEKLPSSHVEKSDQGKEKLNNFREQARLRHCKFWSGAEDLGGKVSRSIIQLKKRHPSDGWVPGRYAADDKMLREIEEMRARVAELEIKALMNNDGPPENSAELAQGNELIEYTTTIKQNKEGEKLKTKLSVTWDKMFTYCGAAIVGECDNEALESKIQLAFWHAVPKKYEDFNTKATLPVPYVVRDKIKVQLQALGLMKQGVKKRAVSDTKNYWALTPYGERYLLQISAVKHKEEKPTVKV